MDCDLVGLTTCRMFGCYSVQPERYEGKCRYHRHRTVIMTACTVLGGRLLTFRRHVLSPSSGYPGLYRFVVLWVVTKFL